MRKADGLVIDNRKRQLIRGAQFSLSPASVFPTSISTHVSWAVSVDLRFVVKIRQAIQLLECYESLEFDNCVTV